MTEEIWYVLMNAQPVRTETTCEEIFLTKALVQKKKKKKKLVRTYGLALFWKQPRTGSFK